MSTQEVRSGRTTRRGHIGVGLLLLAAFWYVAGPVDAGALRQRRGGGVTGVQGTLTVVLGRPTDRSMTLSASAPTASEALVEYGTTPGQYVGRTPVATLQAGEPFEFTVDSLQANTYYFYRLRHRRPGEPAFGWESERMFVTARPPGTAFSFGVQGDSHPEREGRMFNGELYARTLARAQQELLDFYVMLGDDFSIERLIGRGTLSQSAVDQVYATQRSFLGRLSGSTPLFLVNGNHEEAARVLLDGTPNNPAVFAGRARTRFFPLPVPDAFYSGDAEPVEHIGLLRDYYAWTWGDALFVVIDPYWHSSVQVDAEPGGGGGGSGRGRDRTRDLWSVTLGNAQYAWLTRTLEGSPARYKFVFAHHVMGTGRGGIEEADVYEWGGRDRRGVSRFRQQRPTWALPIHQLMVKTGVTIFFQGHDHLFARQEKDGIVYQEVPNPADDTYTAFNRDAYRSGTVLPNAGHLRVTVSSDNVRVDYVRSYLASHETSERQDGDVTFTYTIPPRR